MKEDYVEFVAHLTPTTLGGEDGSCASFEICECCGVTFGHEDATLKGVKKKREEWVASGGQWNNKNEKPSNWSLAKALKNILNKYR